MAVKQVETGLPKLAAPFAWATVSGNILYTAQVPIRADGTFETGSIERQTELVLANLKQTLEAAGGTPADLTQVLVFFTEQRDMPAFNEIYARFLSAPYPNRASFVVAALAVPDMRVELVAYAHLRGGVGNERA